MVNLEHIKELDYLYSSKIAGILSYESKGRTLIQLLTMTGTAIFWMVALVLVYIFVPDFRHETFTIGFVTLVMLFPVFIIKQTVRRNRPDFKDTRLGAVIFDEWSFPSGHATRATYIMMLMPTLTPELAIFWYIWGATMIISRLILGVHYLSDILAGIVLSLILISIAFWLGWLPLVPLYSAIQ